MLRTGVVVVRRTTRVSLSSSSMARVVSETATVRVCPAWLRPRAIFCPQTTMTPVAEARRCTRMGSDGDLGGGERVGPGAQQHPGGGVVEHERVLLDADAGQLPAEDLRREQAVGAE